MKYLITPFLFFAIAFSTFSANAQYRSYKYDYQTDREELYIGGGMITVEQLRGWGGEGNLSGYVSMPYKFSGAWFATYRHFFTNRFAMGITAGLDNETGDLSYGNPEHNATGYDGVSGSYSVRSFSFAIEALWAYFKNAHIMLYGYSGTGATLYENKFTINANAPYGAPVAMPSNPYDFRTTFINGQVTPFGFRFGGSTAGFIEVGFGYKGLVSGGLSVRF